MINDLFLKRRAAHQPLAGTQSAKMPLTTEQVAGRTVLVRRRSLAIPTGTQQKALRTIAAISSKLSEEDEASDDKSSVKSLSTSSVRSAASKKSLTSTRSCGSGSSRSNGQQQGSGFNERIILNIGGQIHETFVATLSRVPDTRLAKLAQEYENDPAFDPDTGTFFFNRNPLIFNFILAFYRTGELHVDHNICGNAIKNVSNACANNLSQNPP